MYNIHPFFPLCMTGSSHSVAKLHFDVEKSLEILDKNRVEKPDFSIIEVVHWPSLQPGLKPLLQSLLVHHFKTFYLFNGSSPWILSFGMVKRGRVPFISRYIQQALRRSIKRIDRQWSGGKHPKKNSPWFYSFVQFCSQLNPDVCDSTLWALLMSFIWATAICPCHKTQTTTTLLFPLHSRWNHVAFTI